jgi:hypothetical protein
VTVPVVGGLVGRAVGAGVVPDGVAAPPDDGPELADPPAPAAADGGVELVGRTASGGPDGDALVAPLAVLDSEGLVDGSVASGCMHPASEPTTRARATAIRIRTGVLIRGDL